MQFAGAVEARERGKAHACVHAQGDHVHGSAQGPIIGVGVRSIQPPAHDLRPSSPTSDNILACCLPRLMRRRDQHHALLVCRPWATARTGTAANRKPGVQLQPHTPATPTLKRCVNTHCAQSPQLGVRRSRRT